MGGVRHGASHEIGNRDVAADGEPAAGVPPGRFRVDADLAGLKGAAAGIRTSGFCTWFLRHCGAAGPQCPHHVDARHSLEQAEGVGVMRRRIDALDRTDRHEFAAEEARPRGLQNERTTARSCEMNSNGHVVAGAQPGEQFEDVRLHRNIEGREDLVADQQLRFGNQGARDGNALAFAA